jgi:hypothetical protein
MKTAFAGILNNPASSLNSHSAGWNRLVRSLVDPEAVFVSEDCDWSKFDRIIINHGPNFKPGAFNIIGGIGEAVLLRLEKLAAAFETAEVYQMDGFNLADFLQKRLPGKYDFDGEIPFMPLPSRDKLVLGDSHSISVWPGSDHAIERRDGQTLWGFMKNPKAADFLYLGNIDVRFHFCRQPDPLKALQSMHALVDRYLQFAASCKAKVSCLLPVESESRKIPGTGLYKGQPFYGSQADRAFLVNEFNSRLMESGLDVHCWPKAWYENIEQYENEIMEPRQSVHIRPKYYANQIRNS